MIARKKRVVWHSKESALKEPRRPPLLPFGQEETPEMTPGDLCVSTCNLATDERFRASKGYMEHSHQYLMKVTNVPSFGGWSGFKAGISAVYMGPLRVEEQNSKGEIINVLRRSFLVNGIVYIVWNNSLFVTA